MAAVHRKLRRSCLARSCYALGLRTISAVSALLGWTNAIVVADSPHTEMLQIMRNRYSQIHTLEVRYTSMEMSAASASAFVARQVDLQQGTDAATGRPISETKAAIALIKSRGKPVRRENALLTVHGKQWDLYREWTTSFQNGDVERATSRACFDGEVNWNALPADKFVQKRRKKLVPIPYRTPLDDWCFRLSGTVTFGLPEFLHAGANLRFASPVAIGAIDCVRITSVAPIPVEARPPQWTDRETLQFWVEASAPHRLVQWSVCAPSARPYAVPPPPGAPQGNRVTINEYSCADYRAVVDERSKAFIEVPFCLSRKGSAGMVVDTTIQSVRLNHLPAGHRISFAPLPDWKVQDLDAPKPGAQVVAGGRKALAKRIDADIDKVLAASRAAKTSSETGGRLALAALGTVLVVAVAWWIIRRLSRDRFGL